MKDGDLYLKNGNKDKVKIDSDVTEVINVYDSGEIYYITEQEDEDNDDTVGDVASETAEFDAQAMLDAFYEDLGVGKTKLCYYNGKKTVEVADIASTGSFSAESAVLVYRFYDTGAIDADELTEENFTDILKDAETPEYRIAVKDESFAIEDAEEISYLKVSSDGKFAYFLDDVNHEKGYGELCKVKISGKLGKIEKIDTDVSTNGLSVTESGKFVYYKEVSDDGTEGELYVDKKRIDYDVKLNSVSYLKDSGKVVYFIDWDSEDREGTLKCSNLSGKSTKISEDVHSFTIAPNEQILYLYDYSTNSYKGELYMSTGKKGTKLDEDVVTILPYINFTELMYLQLGWDD